MKIGVLFWLLMILWALAAVAGYLWKDGGPYVAYVNSFLLFLLFALLGWQAFGPPLQKG